MATIIERQKDITTLFNNKNYYFAHCISSDCKMGAGIAQIFDKYFKLKQKLLSFNKNIRKAPTCIFFNNVYNLITKENYWDKPTYHSLTCALYEMKNHLLVSSNLNIEQFLAMPRIGCGLDKLYWPKVKEIIENVFKNTNNLEILICYL